MQTCLCNIERFLKADEKKRYLFLIFAQNIGCGYIEAVLTSTHNLCFRAKMRK